MEDSKLTFDFEDQETEAVEAFGKHGVIHLGGHPVLSSEQVEACSNASKERFQEIYTHLLLTTKLKGGHAATGKGTKEVVERDGCRFDIRYRMEEEPFGNLAKDGKWMSIVRKILGPTAKLQWTGVVVAAADDDRNGSEQVWHADGEHLFDSLHCPPHCLNVFVPLVDVNEVNGATEFCPGSHHSSASGVGVDKDGCITLNAKAGEAIIFDYRTQHRGGANNSPDDRHVLYFTYSKDWWTDTKNHRSDRSLFDSSAEGQSCIEDSENEIDQSAIQIQLSLENGESTVLSIPEGADMQSAIAEFCAANGLGEEYAAGLTEQLMGAFEVEVKADHESRDKMLSGHKRSAEDANLEGQ